MAKPRKRLKIRTVRIKWLSEVLPSVDEDGNWVMSTTREFDVWIDGMYIGKYDTSERGLIDYAEAMR